MVVDKAMEISKSMLSIKQILKNGSTTLEGKERIRGSGKKKTNVTIADIDKVFFEIIKDNIAGDHMY